MPDPITEEPPYISVLNDLNIPNVPARSELEPAKPKEPEPTPEPEKKDPEPTPTPEPEKKGTRTPASPEGKENFKVVTEKWQKAEKERDELKKSLAERDKKLADMEAQLAELPQTKESAAKLQQSIQQQEEAIQQLNEKLKQSHEFVKAASLERSPEFIAQFVTDRQFHAGQLKDLAANSNISEPDVMRALRNGNSERLLEIRNELPPHDQFRWDALLRKIYDIDIEKEKALQNPDKEWDKIKAQREQAFRQEKAQELEQNRATGRDIFKNLIEKVPFFRENKELQQVVAETIEGIAGGEGGEHWPPQRIHAQAAIVPVLQSINQSQGKMIEDAKAEKEALEKERDELKQKLEERDTFIKARHGSVGDFRQPAAKDGNNGDYDPDRPIHEQIAVRRN